MGFMLPNQSLRARPVLDLFWKEKTVFFYRSNAVVPERDSNSGEETFLWWIAEVLQVIVHLTKAFLNAEFTFNP